MPKRGSFLPSVKQAEDYAWAQGRRRETLKALLDAAPQIAEKLVSTILDESTANRVALIEGIKLMKILELSADNQVQTDIAAEIFGD
jgi:hypothetical protein